MNREKKGGNLGDLNTNEQTYQGTGFSFLNLVKSQKFCDFVLEVDITKTGIFVHLNQT